MRKLSTLLVLLAVLGAVAGCRSYSPNEYNPAGMQQANKVDRAVVKSFREVDVNDPSLGLGTAAGAAAGGIAGSQIGQGGGNAAAVLGGALIGGGLGYLLDREASATKAFEYILEKKDGDLITLAQKEDAPLAAGTRVLILYGVKARIIPDTTIETLPATAQKAAN